MQLILDMYQVLLFYNYTNIENPRSEMTRQKFIWKELNLKGRLIISIEGLNGTLEGKTDNINKYKKWLISDERFADTHFKTTSSNGQSFPKASIKVREELVTLHLKDLDFSPSEVTGKYISPKEFNKLIKSGEEFYIVDMRNNYEYKIGHFRNSFLFKNMSNFRDLPIAIKEIEHLKHKKIVTVCTGGIRCEKASGYLINNGFTDVWQLKGGIHTYLEQYPMEGYLGKLYVFDNRVAIGFNRPDKEVEEIGKCDLCQDKTEKYYDYCFKKGEHRTHGLLCNKCANRKDIILDQIIK